MELRVGDFHEELSGNKGENKAFIDSKIMDQMGLEDGDSVKIEGSSTTVSKAKSGTPGDQGLGIVRMDSYTLENCGSSLGEKVNIRPVDLAEARSVVLAPADKEVMINVEDSKILSNSLNVEYLKEGDKIASLEEDSGFFSGSKGFGIAGTEFIVIETYPDNQVRITDDTEFKTRETKPKELIDENPEEHPVPEEHVLFLADEPQIEDKDKLKDFDQLEKLSDIGALIGCYEEENQRIWIHGNYYYIEEKD